MLSDRLAALSSHFEHWGLRPGGVGLTPGLCATLAGELSDLAEQSRRIEGSPVPPPLRPQLGGNVVEFRRGAAA